MRLGTFSVIFQTLSLKWHRAGLWRWEKGTRSCSCGQGNGHKMHARTHAHTPVLLHWVFEKTLGGKTAFIWDARAAGKRIPEVLEFLTISFGSAEKEPSSLGAPNGDWALYGKERADHLGFNKVVAKKLFARNGLKKLPFIQEYNFIYLKPCLLYNLVGAVLRQNEYIQ